MEFGSSHIYFVRSGGSIATVSDDSGVQQESIALDTLEKAEAAPGPLPHKTGRKGGTTLTYKDAQFDVKNLFNITEDVVDWFGLGTQLEVQHSRLKKIRREIDTEDGRRCEMINYWLNTDPEASWEKLSEALVRVDHRVLADKINQEIVPIQLQHDGVLIPREPITEPDGKIQKTSIQRGYKRPGAPPLVYSMNYQPNESGPVKGKFEADKDRTRSKRIKLSVKDKDPDTNILMIKFGVLSKPCKVHTGDPVICSNDQCAAILNYHSKIIKETGVEGNVWVCGFCNTKNAIQIEAGEIPKEGDILYLQQREHSSKHDTVVSGITKDSIVVFCVDTSGSMGVTTEVPGCKQLKGDEKLQKLKDIYAGSGIQYMPGQYKRVTYISRLQCVQAAVDHQLTMLAQNNPSQRVAIVMFGDEVTVIGDDKPENEVVFVGDKLWKENAILKLTEGIPTPSPVKHTQAHLSEKIFSIEEEGQTALGGALLVSVELAKRAPGSKVILCTDGLANRGVGSLDDHKYTESSKAFYKKLGMSAKESSVSVSVVTIKGTECDLLHIGQVANLSGGNVDVVDPMSLTDEFVNILSTSVVAVRVNAKIILHSTLCFKDGDAKSTLSVPVGNVMDTTKLMYEFSSSEKKQADNIKPQEVPFQVQIKYTSLDGQQCLRVFTEVRPTTSDKGVANEGAISSVMNARRLQEHGNFILNSSSDRQIEFGSAFHDIAQYPSCKRKVIRKPRYSYACVEDDNIDVCTMSCGIIGNSMDTASESLMLPRRRRSNITASQSLSLRRSNCYIGCDEMAATAFKRAQLRDQIANTKVSVGRNTPKVQKCITLSNEGYGFGFLVSPGKEGGTVVQSLVPNGMAWKDGRLQKDDKLLTINGENVENMPHQDVVKKIRQLNEDEANNSITLCIMRQEESQTLPQSLKKTCNTGPSSHEPASDHGTQHVELMPVNLQCDGSDSLGLTLKFDDSEQLIVEEIKSDGIADKDCRLKVNDIVLEINGEAVSGKTDDAISTTVKDVEESNGSLELLVRRGTPATSRTQLHEEQKPSTSKSALERLSSWYRSWRSPHVQEPSQNSNCLKISLHNQGCGFGFIIQEAEDKSIVVSKVVHEGVAHKDGRLRTTDKLIEINGRKVSDMTYKEVVAMLRKLNEDDHSDVSLKVERK